jgi:hypothetical protein
MEADVLVDMPVDRAFFDVLGVHAHCRRFPTDERLSDRGGRVQVALISPPDLGHELFCRKIRGRSSASDVNFRGHSRVHVVGILGARFRLHDDPWAAPIPDVLVPVRG